MQTFTDSTELEAAEGVRDWSDHVKKPRPKF